MHMERSIGMRVWTGQVRMGEDAGNAVQCKKLLLINPSFFMS